MKITFGEKDSKQVISKIQNAMEGRKLAEMVAFSLDGSELVVTISKLGTSTLRFASTSSSGGTEFTLKSEKIALAHKAFKDEVKEKIFGVIEKAGGVIAP